MSIAMATVLVLVVVVTCTGLTYVMVTGLSARPRPGAFETRVARTIRGWAVPRALRDRPNPLQGSSAALDEGLTHFADHCATCHANDGSGDTTMGQGLFPKPPDLRARPTQTLSDGELFYVIENGVRFTGMPAFATGDAAGEEASWQLVLFIRHLPRLTPAEIVRMESMNPRSPSEIRRELEDERFLQGDSVAPPHESGGHNGAHR